MTLLDDPNAVPPAAALDAAEVGVWALNFAHGTVWGDRHIAEVMGLADQAAPWPSGAFFDRLHDGDLELVHQAMMKAQAGDTAMIRLDFRVKPAPTTQAAPPVWVRTRARVTERGADGTPLRLTGLAWRITQAAHAPDKAERMMADLTHRVNNTFAVIRALVSLGETTAKDLPSFTDTLRNQVEALSIANKISTEAAQAQVDSKVRAPLLTVVEAALASRLDQGMDDGCSVQITCPAAIRLGPTDLSNFAMVLFELAANAVKHGALRGAGGQVRVDVVEVAAGRITCDWSEVCTAPIAAAPPQPSDHPSLGEVVLNLCASNLDATYQRTFHATGMHFRLEMAGDMR